MIRLYEDSDRLCWDDYTLTHPHATPWHLAAWKYTFEGTYGHKGYYLIARENDKVTGVLPLFLVKSLVFGKSLVSMPFLDAGGPLGDDEHIEMELVRQAARLGTELSVQTVEVRMAGPRAWTQRAEPRGLRENGDREATSSWSINAEKVRMILPLPPDPKDLMSSFKSKLRSQIRKPIREGCESVIGGAELLDDFYRVFSVNMRDLGSPVHAKKLFANVLLELGDRVRICLVNKGERAIAGGVVICFRDIMANPWASSLREFGSISPNMLLYWTMLRLACENDCKIFDFGRSSIGQGTYRFKEQWGARPEQLVWQHLYLNHSQSNKSLPRSRNGLKALIGCWKRLPVPLANAAGPIIRKQISL